MSEIKIIGVDPGLRGGMALLLDGGGPGLELELKTIPVIPGKTRTGKDGKTKRISRDQYDLTGIAHQLLEWAAGGAFAYVEQSIPFPPTLKAGSLAQFQRGVCRGWAWMLTALQIPYALVHPRTWQKLMLAGLPKNDKKQSSILQAQRLFPDVDLRRNERCKVPHDGLAEALLLAEYGRRVRTGAALESQITNALEMDSLRKGESYK